MQRDSLSQAPAKQQARSGQQQEDETHQVSCLTCRVVGTGTCTVCSGVMFAQLYRVPAPTGLHRWMCAGFGAGFAVMAVIRAATP